MCLCRHRKRFPGLRLQRFDQYSMQEMFILTVLFQTTCENLIVRKGKAVRKIVQRHTKAEPLRRCLYPTFLELLYEVYEVFLGIFRIVTVQKLILERTSCVAHQIPIRLHTSQQKRPAADSIQARAIPLQQKTP